MVFWYRQALPPVFDTLKPSAVRCDQNCKKSSDLWLRNVDQMLASPSDSLSHGDSLVLSEMSMSAPATRDSTFTPLSNVGVSQVGVSRFSELDRLRSNSGLL